MAKVLFLVIALLVIPSDLYAQKDPLRLQEKLGAKVLKENSEFDISIGPSDGQVVQDGGLVAQKLPDHIAVVLKFLIHWGHGKFSAPPDLISPAVTLLINDKEHSWRSFQFRLPFRGLTTVKEKDVVVGVKVGAFQGLRSIENNKIIIGKMIVKVSPRDEAKDKFIVTGIILTTE